MKDLFESITILLGLLTLVFGVLQYFWQKRFDEKLRVYRNYLEIVAFSTLPHDEQIKIQLEQKHILAKQELVLFAPKGIVDLVGEIEPIDFTKGDELKYSRYLCLINLMRKDLQKLNKRVSEKTLRKLLG